MKDQLIEIVKEALELDSASINDYFESYDTWDSLGKLSLIALIDEHFSIQISDKEFTEFKTVEDLYNSLSAKKS
tara:strand:- start:444 stop:665 length:222 start_codon:yes stop_codon:yes gene_type:complete